MTPQSIRMYLEELAISLQGKSNIDVHSVRVDVLRFLLETLEQAKNLEIRQMELISDRDEAVERNDTLVAGLKELQIRLHTLIIHPPTGELPDDHERTPDDRID